MALSSTEEDIRVYVNARVLVALRNCLIKLQTFYTTLQDAPFIASQPHPRYFPYSTTFMAEDGSLTRFRYLASLEEDAACVTYLANETGVAVKVVVKFAARYGKEVHEFLARKGYAPTTMAHYRRPNSSRTRSKRRTWSLLAVGSHAYGCNGLHPCSIQHTARCSWADPDHFNPAAL